MILSKLKVLEKRLESLELSTIPTGNGVPNFSWNALKTMDEYEEFKTRAKDLSFQNSMVSRKVS
jgi:hypothetical protein